MIKSMRRNNEPDLLAMIREGLEDLPSLALPPEFSIRPFREGESPVWERIVRESFGHHESFDKEMRSEYAYAPDRIFFLCFQEEAVGTAAAMYRPEWGESRGYLHFLAMLPTYSGKGLGVQISLRALLKMREEGRLGAVLETTDFRIAAIKTYLKLGFEPLLVHSEQRNRWWKIFASLGVPDLELRFRERLEGPIFTVKKRC